MANRNLKFLFWAFAWAQVPSLLPAIALGSHSFSVAEADAVAIIDKCVKLPNLNEVRELVTSHYQSQPRQKEYSYAEIDGMPLIKISAVEVADIEALTQSGVAHKYSVLSRRNVESVGPRISITRTCRESWCIENAMPHPNSLAEFSTGKPCSSALCAAEKIFGSTNGPYILWAYLRWGLLLSQFYNVEAAKYLAWTERQLKAILIAAALIPETLTSNLHRQGFFLADPDKPYDKNLYANATGIIYPPTDQLDIAMLAYVLYHEMGHWIAANDDYVESRAWLAASEWPQIYESIYRPPLKSPTYQTVSLYAGENAVEDFAESFAFYRFNSSKLRGSSPKRYDYMKTHVYNRVEFLDDDCDTNPTQKVANF